MGSYLPLQELCVFKIVKMYTHEVRAERPQNLFGRGLYAEKGKESPIKQILRSRLKFRLSTAIHANNDVRIVSNMVVFL